MNTPLRWFALACWVIGAGCTGETIPASGATRAAELEGDDAVAANPSCTMDPSLDPDFSHAKAREAAMEIAPTGTLRVGVNYGNPNNALYDSTTGTLKGVAVDLACRLAANLPDTRIAFVPYPGQNALQTGHQSGQWDIGFSFDATDVPTGFAPAHAHIAVPNTYLVRSTSPFQHVADLDKPGVTISVGINNSTDHYLTAHIQYATIVRTATVPQALALFKAGKANAFAGSRSVEVAFLTQMPDARLLPDDLFVAYLASAITPNRPDAMAFLDAFLEGAKVSGLVQAAIDRAHLVGVLVAPLVPLPHPGDGDEGHGAGVDDLGDATDDGVDHSADYPDAEPDADFR